MKEIKLTRGKFALVDDADFEFLNQWKWAALKRHKTWYAGRSVKIPKTRNSNVILMHRVILNLNGSSKVCDHINHNGLDNQRHNLRSGTHNQNHYNIPKRSNTTSKFKGVCYYPKRGKYMAYITHNSKRIYLGWHFNEKEAAIIYNKKAVELHGEFALLNPI